MSLSRRHRRRGKFLGALGLCFGLLAPASVWAKPLATSADSAIQRAIDFTTQALAAPPERRDSLWEQAESACTRFIDQSPANPRRVVVEVQRGLVLQARGVQARQAGEFTQAIEHLRTATRLLDDVAESVDGQLVDLRLRPQRGRPAESLSVEEMESLGSNVAFQLARTRHYLGLCHPRGSPDRDDALLQAVAGLTPLSQRAPADELAWNARNLLASCLRALGRVDAADKLVAAWLRENPPADAAQRLSAEPATAPSDSSFASQGPPPDEFDAEMAAAAAEREAGRLAPAIERYRTLARRDPNHPRAGEAHRLALLCMADSLRASPPANRSALAESYERLLREHLSDWPRDASANEVRLWLGQLLAARRDWAGAAKVLQQREPSSAGFAENVQLLVRCYEGQLRQLERQSPEDSHRREQLLAAAANYLQPIVTGPTNRWPDPWNTLQRDTALALARLHLRFSMQPPYATQLLSAALRGRHADPDPEQFAAWEATAKLLLVESLARGGRGAEARAMVEQLAKAPTAALLETLAAIDGALGPDSTTAAAVDEDVGELMLSLLRLLDTRRSELNAGAATRLGGWRARALSAAGDRPAALAQYAALAVQSPDDGKIQEGYAALLAASESPADLRQALARWQAVEARSRRGGPRWQRARRARIELLTRLGEQAEAEKLVQLTRLLYPDWDTPLSN